MEPNKKRQKLIHFCESILDHPDYQTMHARLAKKLGLSRQTIIDEYVAYDLDLDVLDNSIYESIANRFVLYLHSILPTSFDIDRQQAFLDLVIASQAKTMADIGFGVPGRYVKDYILKNSALSLALFDLYDTAFDFAGALLDEWSPSWSENITFTKHDMNTGDFIGDFDLYFMLDSIEHINEPTDYLKTHVNQSSSHAQFILSLPICPLIPIHTIAWETVKEGMEWLQSCGLEVTQVRIAHVNPLIDLFAEQMDYTIHNLIVLCRKR